MFSQVFTIARNTFIESIRQPVFVVLFIVATLALTLNVSLAAYTLKNDDKLLVDLGLSSLFITGLFLAAFTATGVLSREIENKTVLTVISKPMSRPLFVIGKFVGVACAIAVAYWTLSMVFLMTVRHQVMQTAGHTLDGPVIVFGVGAIGLALFGSTLANYLYHRVFPSTFVISAAVLSTIGYGLVLVIGKEWNFQSPAVDFNGQLMIGLSLVFEALLILTAIAIAASTRTGQLMTLMICTGVFLFGLISDYVLGKWADTSMIGEVLYRITPNLQLLWPADALTQEFPIRGHYIGYVSAYCAMYVGAILAIAIGLFQTREVG